MGESRQVDIIIVSYNSGEFLERCLDSLSAVTTDGITVRALVVDNASRDGTPERLALREAPWMQLHRNDQNLGFAKAANIGIRKTDGEFILLLNPDTVLPPAAVLSAVRFLDETPEAAIVSPRLVLRDGSIDPGCHRGFPTPWASLTYMLGLERLFPRVRMFNGYHRWDLPLDTVHPVDAVSGAFMLFRRSLVERIGLFDERFFMYGEDIDFCLRAKEAGGLVYYDPRTEVVHVKGTSSGIKGHSAHLSKADQQTRQRAMRAFYESMLLFYDKHYAAGNPRVLRWAVHRGIGLARAAALWRLKRSLRNRG